MVQGVAPRARTVSSVRSTWLVPGLAGGAQALALAWPWGGLWAGEPLPWLQGLSLLGLVWALRGAPSARVAGARAWVFAVAWLAGTFWWLFISMHTYGGLAAPLAALAVLALATALGTYYAIAGMWFWRWRQASPVRQGLAFAALWTLAEWARGTWFTGFPWGAGGYALVDALAAWAPYVGVYGMGALSAGLAAWAVAWWGDRAQRGRLSRLLAGGLLLAYGGSLCVPAAGRWLAGTLPAHTQSTGVLGVTLLQGNVPQDEKFQADTGVPFALAWYGAHLRAALAPGGAAPTLVLAPETAIPVLPQQVEPAYWKALLGDVKHSQSALMLGLPLGNGDDGFTNSVVAWTPAVRMYRYDKHHLVPFGEFIPPLFRWFVDLMHIPLGDFNRGGLGQPALAWAGQRIAPNVCYEDLFGEELAASFREPAQAPTVLANVSNLAWFGDTVAIDQHRHISRLRALELQRPMLRATNTGATVVIDHLGQVTHALPSGTRGTLQGTVEGREGLTPYARWAGHWGLWPLVGVCVLVLLAVRPRRIGPLPS